MGDDGNGDGSVGGAGDGGGGDGDGDGDGDGGIGSGGGGGGDCDGGRGVGGGGDGGGGGACGSPKGIPGGSKGDGDSGSGEGGGLGGGSDGDGGGGVDGGGDGDGDGGGGFGGVEGGEGGSEGGGIGGKMVCCTSTDRALSSRPRLADTVERTCSADKLPSSSAFASSAPPCSVTDSTTMTLLRVLLVTFTPLASSCRISATPAVVLPSLSERESVEVRMLPLCSARRRLVASVQLGEMSWQAFSSLAAVSSASSPTTYTTSQN